MHVQVVCSRPLVSYLLRNTLMTLDGGMTCCKCRTISSTDATLIYVLST